MNKKIKGISFKMLSPGEVELEEKAIIQLIIEKGFNKPYYLIVEFYKDRSFLIIEITEAFKGPDLTDKVLLLKGKYNFKESDKTYTGTIKRAINSIFNQAKLASYENSKQENDLLKKIKN